MPSVSDTPSTATLQHIRAETYEEPVQTAYNMTEYGCVYYSASWWMLYPPYFGQMFMLYLPLGAGEFQANVPIILFSYYIILFSYYQVY
eukprot:SAG31_NODE_33545_length_342_cov_1.259259_1_plen_88_part_01